MRLFSISLLILLLGFFAVFPITPIPVSAQTPTPSPQMSVAIQPPSIDILLTNPPVGLSALLYDENHQPVWSGVTYQWGISSTNDVGTLIGIKDDLASFVPLNVGNGELYVIATNNGQTITGSIPITVRTTYSLADLRLLVTNYLHPTDTLYQPQDAKVNSMDASFVLRWINNL